MHKVSVKNTIIKILQKLFFKIILLPVQNAFSDKEIQIII